MTRAAWERALHDAARAGDVDAVLALTAERTAYLFDWLAVARLWPQEGA